jgi:hypothetical protein
MPLGALDIIIAADTAQLRKGMDEAVGLMKSSTQKMESFAKTAGASIAGYFALDNLQNSIKQSLDLADSIGKMSQKIGMSVDDLYSLQAAGRLSDIALQDIGKSVLKLNKNLGEISMGGGKDAQNALENLGISSKDVNGHIKDSNTILLEVADRFKDMPNGVAKSTLAMQLFGKSGADMIPLLNGGSEAIKEFNGHMDKTTTDAAERFNDSFTRIGLSIDGAKVKLLTSMVPAIDLLSGHIEDLSGWIVTNSSDIDLFANRAMNDFSALGEVGGDAFSLIGDTSTVMVNTVSDAFDFMADEVLGSSDEMVNNFGFFEYFILGLSTATNGIGQFIANTKMAYATVAETHAKYGSISGLLTDGGYDAAKARMDYHSASLEAEKYTKNVVNTYKTLAGLKNKFKSDYKPEDNSFTAPFYLEDYDKKISEAKKAAKELADIEQKMFDERINDGIKRFQDEIVAKEKADQEYLRSSETMYSAINDASGNWYDNEIVNISNRAAEFAAAGNDIVDIERYVSASILSIDEKRAKEQADLAQKTFEEQNKFWFDLMGNINKAMDDQFFNAMTGKFESFGSWLKDFWGAMTNSLARGLSKSLADAMIDTGAGGIQNIFKTFGGLGSVFGSAATPAALIGATTDSAGFTTTAGGTVMDAGGQVTLQGSDYSSVMDALNIASTANTAYSLLTGGLTAALYAPSAMMGQMAGMAYGAGLTGTGSFLAGGANVLAGGGVSGLSGAAYAGGLATAGIAGGIGGYAMGSIGDKLLGADTKAADYGAIGGAAGAMIGSVVPVVGTLVGAVIGSALGSLIGGAFGKTKTTGSGIQAWSDITTESGAGAVQSYVDFKKKSWFKSSSWTNYYGLSEKEQKAIEGMFETYDYLLGQLGDLDTIVVSAGRYSGTEFYSAIDKSFIRAFVDNPALTDTFYSAWTEYASGIGKAVQETFATMVSGYVDYTRNYKTWMLESSGDTLESLRLQAEWAQGDLNAYSNLIGVSGVTIDNYLDMYSQAIKTTFTPEAINNWQKLGDALKNSTELTKSYTDALKEQSTYIPADMMLQKVGATNTSIDIKQLVNQQGAQTEQTAQLVAVLTETVKILKKQLTATQISNNQGVTA